MVVALAFRIHSYGAERVRQDLLKRITHGRKEKTNLFVSLFTDSKPNGSWQAWRHINKQAYHHVIISTNSPVDMTIRGLFLFQRKAEQSFSYIFNRAWQGMFWVTQNLSGYSRKCARRNTARCLCSRSKRFEQLEKSCRPCRQFHFQSWEIKFSVKRLPIMSLNQIEAITLH